MLTIRRAREQDFADILKIQAEAFGEYQGLYDVNAWTKETLENINLDTRDKIILVAEWEGMLVGSARFWVVAGVCVIRLLSVKPSYQGRGIGKALMQDIERLARDAHKLYVCTMLRTPRNITLFLSLGYRPEAVLPDHYHHTDFICFSKHLKLAS
jgi:ribosomal protein S18 acetylase RimI-like enzyme